MSVLCLAVFSQPRKILQIIVKTHHSVGCQMITKVDVIMYPKTITVLAREMKNANSYFKKILSELKGVTRGLTIYSLILLLLGSGLLVLTLTPHQSVEMITFFWR